MAVLGQAAGAASFPFFASLFNQGRLADFASAVNGSVSRILIFSFLLSAWMIGLAYPAVDIIFRGGSFHRGDSVETAHYFAIFAVSLFLWTGQAIYARAFYAAGDTLTPMAAGVIVTLISLPIYWLLYRAAGAIGLSSGSDIAILLQTAVLVLLLHRRRIVRFSGLERGANRPTHLSSRDSPPQSLEFWGDGRQSGHYTRFGVTSGWAGSAKVGIGELKPRCRVTVLGAGKQVIEATLLGGAGFSERCRFLGATERI